MKKYIFFFAAAALSLAACSKNEVTPAFSDENAEITFNVAPKTKADAQNPSDFSHDNVFASWAYYLPNGKTWDANRTDANDYIINSTISYQNDNTWKETGKSYYWPKGGKLTFFAYSLNKGDLTFNSDNMSHFTCYNAATTYGINGLIDLDDNPNTDFLVAQVAADQTGNVKTYNHNGVPTLFKHRLSKVSVAVKKAADYENVTFILNSVKFNKLTKSAHYAQFNDEDKDGVFNEYMKEGDNRSTQVYTNTDFEVESKDDFVAVPAANEVRYIYIPQDFKGQTEEDKVATIEVNYTIQTKVGPQIVNDVCTKTINVKDVFDSWEMGKKYVLDLTFSLDEILWDPAVEDWITDAAGSIEIK